MCQPKHLTRSHQHPYPSPSLPSPSAASSLHAAMIFCMANVANLKNRGGLILSPAPFFGTGVAVVCIKQPAGWPFRSLPQLWPIWQQMFPQSTMCISQKAFFVIDGTSAIPSGMIISVTWSRELGELLKSCISLADDPAIEVISEAVSRTICLVNIIVVKCCRILKVCDLGYSVRLPNVLSGEGRRAHLICNLQYLYVSRDVRNLRECCFWARHLVWWCWCRCSRVTSNSILASRRITTSWRDLQRRDRSIKPPVDNKLTSRQSKLLGWFNQHRSWDSWRCWKETRWIVFRWASQEWSQAKPVQREQRKRSLNLEYICSIGRCMLTWDFREELDWLIDWRRLCVQFKNP